MEDRETITFGHIRMFVLGGVVGAVAALLLAPKTGKEMRGDIKDRAGRLKDSASENWQNISAKASENWQNVATRGKDVVEKVTNRSREMYEKSSEALVDQKDRLGAAITAGKSAAKDAYGTRKDAPAGAETKDA